MDLNEMQRSKLLHEEITRVIIGCAFDVINELGSGFVESVYEKAMIVALREKGLSVIAQQPIRVFFRGECVGEFISDLFVEGRVIVELKAVRALASEHEAQIINYLNATGTQVGLLINFGNQKLDYKRFTRSKNFDADKAENRDS